MKTFLLILFLFSAQASFTQNYRMVDSIVKNYPKEFKSIESFAKKIESDFIADIDKTRAVYYWISNNIFYDYKSRDKGKSVYQTISYQSEEEYKQKQLKQELKYANRCLNKKTALCEGYSQLLKFTLLELGIECEVVSGFTKSSINNIGKERSISDHAWNAVKINNEWKLIDATWSTGNRIDKPLKFNFTDVYFMPNPNKFILNHFPENSKWQLLEKPINKSSFFVLPIVKTAYFNSGLEISTFNKGTIRVDSDNTIKLRIMKIDSTKSYNYIFENERFTSELEFYNKNGYHFSNIRYNPKLGKSLKILDNNGVTILEYKIES